MIYYYYYQIFFENFQKPVSVLVTSKEKFHNL